MPDAIYVGTSESHLGSLPPYGITVPSGAGGFSPVSIPGLIGWWDFSDATTLFTDSARTTLVAADADPIGGVTDKSGAGHHLSQAGATARPAYKVAQKNGRSVVIPDGVNDYLSTGAAWAADLTMSFVFVTKQANTFAHVFFGIGTNNQPNIITTASVYRLRADALTLDDGAGAGLTAWNIVACNFNGVSSKLWVGGGAAATGDFSTQATGSTGVMICTGDSTPVSFDTAQYGEGFAFSSPLALSDLNSLGAYLALRWNITWTVAS